MSERGAMNDQGNKAGGHSIPAASAIVGLFEDQVTEFLTILRTLDFAHLSKPRIWHVRDARNKGYYIRTIMAVLNLDYERVRRIEGPIPGSPLCSFTEYFLMQLFGYWSYPFRDGGDGTRFGQLVCKFLNEEVMVVRALNGKNDALCLRNDLLGFKRDNDEGKDGDSGTGGPCQSCGFWDKDPLVRTSA